MEVLWWGYESICSSYPLVRSLCTHLYYIYLVGHIAHYTLSSNSPVLSYRTSADAPCSLILRLASEKERVRQWLRLITSALPTWDHIFKWTFPSHRVYLSFDASWREKHNYVIVVLLTFWGKKLLAKMSFHLTSSGKRTSDIDSDAEAAWTLQKLSFSVGFGLASKDLKPSPTFRNKTRLGNIWYMCPYFWT